MDKSYYQLFAAASAKEHTEIDFCQAGKSAEAPACRIPSVISAVTPEGEECLVAVCDISQSGGDHGRIQVVSRISRDGGKTFGEMKTVLSLPAAKAPQNGEDYRCAFAIDPVLCQCSGGDILMIVDMFPESKAIMHKSWLYKGHGYVSVNGKMYLGLHSGKTKVGTGRVTGEDKVFTVREKGWIYDSEGRKTSYYLPENHNAEYNWETMGDMYFAVDGKGEYIDKTPPLMPENKQGHDIYVGNVYLSVDKGEFSFDKPVFAEKRKVSPKYQGERYSIYDCIETKAAPLSVLPSMHMWVMRSCDGGESWQQPQDITFMIKRDDEIFLGTGPGVALRLENQKSREKNGRILAPVYNLKGSFVIYSDDNGYSWKRSESSRNIDETQLIEKDNGDIFCFGRQHFLGKTPFSVSRDGGESWEKLKPTALSAVKCQKSFLMLAENSEDFPYAQGMDKKKRYVVASCASGHYQKDSCRFGGVVTIGEIQGDKIKWLRQRKIITPGIKSDKDNFYAYSCLCAMKNGEIGLMYEALPVSLIAFRSFSLQWLWQGEKAFGFPLSPISFIKGRLTK